MRADDLLPLLRHMEWADSLMWRGVLALPPASQADPTLRRRLLHIHLVQRAFLGMWRDAPLTSFPSPEDFPDLPALAAYARPYYGEALGLIGASDDRELAKPQRVPHSEQLAPPGGSVTVATRAETVLQVALHTTYHRGQVATQLRDLGGEPPLSDFAVWIWLGRPAPTWPEYVTPTRTSSTSEATR
jgi:uncharacterized damage-inducible protein DinB